jgi:hypothetical protein
VLPPSMHMGGTDAERAEAAMREIRSMAEPIAAIGMRAIDRARTANIVLLQLLMSGVLPILIIRMTSPRRSGLHAD